MAIVFNDPVTQKIVDFLLEIGLEVIMSDIDGPTFLPGILVDHGRLLVDEARLKYPGDLFHEAGHLALASGDIRGTLSGEVILPGMQMATVEAAAMAWSYAAALHLGLDPAIVFHKDGYLGRAAGLLMNFQVGVYIGVNGLEDAGLTVTREKATDLSVEPYPHMIRWLRR